MEDWKTKKQQEAYDDYVAGKIDLAEYNRRQLLIKINYL
jgi:hypothetical protein